MILLPIQNARAMPAAAKQLHRDIALGIGEHLPNSIDAFPIIMGGDQQSRTFSQAIGQCCFGLKAFVIQPWRKRNGPAANITRGTAHQRYIRADAGAHHDQTALANMLICRQPVDPVGRIVNRQVPVNPPPPQPPPPPPPESPWPRRSTFSTA